jgi:hypothetical protein
VKLYFWTEDRHIARMEGVDGAYKNAGVLRGDKWVPTMPAELLWNANPVTKEEAIKRALNYTRPRTTKEALLALLKEVEQ